MHDHGPLPPHLQETIELWVSDFLERPAAAEPAGRVGTNAGPVLVAFFEGACHGGTPPADIEGHDVAHAMFDHVAALQLPLPVHDAVPALVSAFLIDLEEVGRLAGGRELASQVRASTPAYKDRAAGRVVQDVRPAAKIGRNDPCPCGSGTKYKRCCMNTLG
ncbi:MAG: SEC-C metal-binding domain-containing protein [Planctomycetota bacterium]|nr:SEC-C metal-binding domain-containing protein [Planctomycetota bacterium]